MMKLTETFPKRLREARGALTGREFARRCGIKAQSLSRYERIGGQLPGAELLATFARTAGVSADWLLGLTDERTPSANAAPVATPEQRAAIEDGARMGVELLPMMRDILRVLAADGVSISARKGCQRAKVEPLFSAWRFAGVVRIAVALREGA